MNGLCEFHRPNSADPICRRCNQPLPLPRALAQLPLDQLRRACPKAPAAETNDPTACLHRGPIAREIGCRNCRGQEIKIPIHACAIHGECSLRDYTARSTEFEGVQICAGCPNQKPIEPELPGKLTQAGHLARDVAADLRAGRPRRSANEINALFSGHCRGCPAYNAAEGACSKCGCPVSPDEPEWNRLAWAALGCGDQEDPKFGPRTTDHGPRTINTLHLLYHIWPTTATESWRWNVAQLLKRIDLFNGRRIVAVATDDRTATIDDVRRAFAGHQVELIERPNDPRLREAATFPELMSHVETDDPTHATFYAHAKGTSRRGKLLIEAIDRWTETMYRENLDNLDRVKTALATHAMLGVSFTCEPRWRYPGTFWWVHNASVFARDTWKKIENPITKEGPGWAVEAFPERTFAAEECASITIDLDAPAGMHRSLYAPEVWGLGCPETLDAALARFSEADYLAMYADVAAGVAAGDWASGRDHFLACGFAERRPI